MPTSTRTGRETGMEKTSSDRRYPLSHGATRAHSVRRVARRQRWLSPQRVAGRRNQPRSSTRPFTRDHVAQVATETQLGAMGGREPWIVSQGWAQSHSTNANSPKATRRLRARVHPRGRRSANGSPTRALRDTPLAQVHTAPVAKRDRARTPERQRLQLARLV